MGDAGGGVEDDAEPSCSRTVENAPRTFSERAAPTPGTREDASRTSRTSATNSCFGSFSEEDEGSWTGRWEKNRERTGAEARGLKETWVARLGYSLRFLHPTKKSTNRLTFEDALIASDDLPSR